VVELQALLSRRSIATAVNRLLLKMDPTGGMQLMRDSSPTMLYFSMRFESEEMTQVTVVVGMNDTWVDGDAVVDGIVHVSRCQIRP